MKESFKVTGEIEQEQKPIKQSTIHKLLNRLHRSKETAAPVEAIKDQPAEPVEIVETEETQEDAETKQRKEIVSYLLSSHPDQLKDEGLKRSDIKAMSLEELQNLQDRLTFKNRNEEASSDNDDEKLYEEILRLASRKKEEEQPEEIDQYIPLSESSNYYKKLPFSYDMAPDPDLAKKYPKKSNTHHD